ncbi:hypothetical protein J2T57_004127 [Natronocella acetinitrilica]|uniref:DUF1468 domain-containing protein n=1 Tax=Natronocella acetinitrilica TaxID=414046 RepID=A0AAE3KE16_9GAMM|nr:tripartite tricarboxylate transporter TctB family protein [Natronocella acetinitrilica]MCP1676953.1 hypothetical protein [Natronocella acetinitrilica]
MLKQRLVAIGALLVAIGLYTASVWSGKPGYQFPQIVALTMIVLTGVLTVLALKPGRPVVPDDVEPVAFGVLWPSLLLIAGYAFLAPRLGFISTSFLAFALVGLVYNPEPLTTRRVLVTCGISAAFMTALYLLFVVLLNVRVPTGILL